ncbi:MAG: DciA family protein, partial [Chitinophagales bacterium]
VQTIWREQMGKSISTYTAEIAVRKKVLYLTILSAPLRQELSYSKDKIMMLMNQELGDGYITEVVIQ